jgi:hypothetical protein
MKLLVLTLMIASTPLHAQSWRECIRGSIGPGGCESIGPGGGKSIGPGGGMSLDNPTGLNPDTMRPYGR